MGSKHSKKAVKYDIEQFSASPNNNNNSSPDNGSKAVDVISQDQTTKQEEPLEPEELLTQNIFELLSCDLQMYILTFLCMRDLYHISLSCQHGAYLVLSPEADGYVWKLMASHLGFNNEETIRALMQELEERENIKEDDQPKNKSKKKNKMWKLFHRMTLDDHSSTSKSITSSENGGDGGEKAIEVTEALEKQDQDNGEEGVVSPTLSDDNEKNHSADENLTGEDLATNEGIVVDYPPNMWRSLVHSNLMKWAPETRTSDTDIKMHNNNKTISCERQSKWDTIRTNRKLEMGMVHGWEYVLDDHDNGGYNSYRVFVGIEKSTYAFTEVGFDKIIGYNSEGVSYNVGEHTVHRDNSHQLNDRSVLHEKHFVFSTGDTIGIKLDLKNLSSSKKASMYLFKNNKYFMTISDIATKGIVYYPAISVIGHQKVSIRMKHPSMLDINNSV